MDMLGADDSSIRNLSVLVPIISGIVSALASVGSFWLAYGSRGERRQAPGITVNTKDGGVGAGGNVTRGVAAGRDITGVVAGRDVRDSNIITGDQPVVADTVIYQSAQATTPPTSLHQLRAPPGDFTGREVELAELLGKIGEGGVTISGIQGMGGIGKTALALKLAQQLEEKYPDAQILVNLRGAHEQEPLSPSDAMAHVVRSFDRQARYGDEDELRGLYNSVLSGKRALLLMDNARDSAQVESLVPPSSCLLLVTSRQHFTLPELHPIELDTLPPDDARDLLLKIAPRIGDHADAIAGLCGYLPEALRLAASALAERPDLDPADYVERLEDSRTRLDFVEASLGLSYDLLGPELQAQWRSLAVFPETFIHIAASAVLEVEPDEAKDSLSELLRYSMVEWDEASGRYRLHDLARLVANSCLRENERDTAQRRHATHYMLVLLVADKRYLKGGEDLMRGLAIYDLEWPNIQGGQGWAASLAGEDDAAARLCSNYSGAADLLGLRHHPNQRIQWLESALAAAQRLKDRRAEAHHLGNLVVAYRERGEPRRGIEDLDHVLELMRELGDRRGESTALGALGSSYRFLGEPRRAIEYYEQQMEIARETGDRRGECTALGNIGLAHYDLGESRQAIEYHEHDLEIAREIGDRRGEGSALGNLGIAYQQLGDPRRAIEYYEQQLEITREIGNLRGVGSSLYNMALALDDLGERDKAIEYAEAALEIFEQIEDPDTGIVREVLAEWRKGE